MAERRRVYKVADKIRAVLANQLLRSGDPRFNLVTLSAVTVSPDLRYAKVYWVVTGGKERAEEVQEAFESAASHFRRQVGSELKTRLTPELKFFYDDTFDTVDEVERLLARIK